jgi:hypothetical protein
MLGLALVASARAADDPAPKDEVAAKAIQEAQQEMQTAVQAKLQELQAKYQKLVKENADQATLQAVQKEFADFQRLALAKPFKVAAKYPGTEAALGVFQSMMQLGGDEAANARKLVLKHQVDKPWIKGIAFGLAQSTDPADAELLKVIRKKNPDRVCQGYATLGLALWHKGQVEAASPDKQAKLVEDAKELLAIVKEQYADVDLGGGRTLGGYAAGQAAGVENLLRLQVGKEMIEHEGEDTDGNTFKLSDYRGKVVFLDFWAFW